MLATRLLVAVALACCFTLAGCGALDDAKDKAKEGVEVAKREAKKLGKKADELREKVTKRVNAVLAKIEGVFPRADEDTPVPTLRVENKFGKFTTDVMDNVGRYWTVTFTENEIRRPRVRYRFVGRGQRIRSALGRRTVEETGSATRPGAVVDIPRNGTKGCLGAE